MTTEIPADAQGGMPPIVFSDDANAAWCALIDSMVGGYAHVTTDNGQDVGDCIIVGTARDRSGMPELVVRRHDDLGTAEQAPTHVPSEHITRIFIH